MVIHARKKDSFMKFLRGNAVWIPMANRKPLTRIRPGPNIIFNISTSAIFSAITRYDVRMLTEDKNKTIDD